MKVSDNALLMADTILRRCDALGGTFDPAASPVTGGYAIKGDAGSGEKKGLQEDLAMAQKHLERAIRNRDAEEIREYREEIKKLRERISNAKSDAQQFNRGDHVMDRETQKMGVVVESEGGKTTVDWRDGRRTTVKTSSLKG